MLNKKKVIKTSLSILLGLVIVLPYFGVYYLSKWYQGRVEEIKNAKFILVDKGSMKLSLIDFRGKTVLEYPIACGKNSGNKQSVGDMKTPEGVFHVSEVQDASSWTHDFGDGKGEIEGAYGPYFIRLDTPGHKGIGIHGTHIPESIGSRATEGCIRLQNNDVAELKNYVYSGMLVIITPSVSDAIINAEKN